MSPLKNRRYLSLIKDQSHSRRNVARARWHASASSHRLAGGASAPPSTLHVAVRRHHSKSVLSRKDGGTAPAIDEERYAQHHGVKELVGCRKDTVGIDWPVVRHHGGARGSNPERLRRGKHPEVPDARRTDEDIMDPFVIDAASQDQVQLRNAIDSGQEGLQSREPRAHGPADVDKGFGRSVRADTSRSTGESKITVEFGGSLR